MPTIKALVTENFTGANSSVPHFHQYSVSTQNARSVFMGVSVQYDLVGRGWAECLIEIEQQQMRLTASYLSNALADLLDAMVAVVRGAKEARASFREEPGEYRLQFKRISQDKLCIRISWFNGTWNNSDGEDELLLNVECRTRTFAGAVLSASQRLLTTYGLEGYREKWVNHEFPISLQAELQEALAKP